MEKKASALLFRRFLLVKLHFLLCVFGTTNIIHFVVFRVCCGILVSAYFLSSWHARQSWPRPFRCAETNTWKQNNSHTRCQFVPNVRWFLFSICLDHRHCCCCRPRYPRESTMRAHKHAHIQSIPIEMECHLCCALFAATHWPLSARIAISAVLCCVCEPHWNAQQATNSIKKIVHSMAATVRFSIYIYWARTQSKMYEPWATAKNLAFCFFCCCWKILCLFFMPRLAAALSATLFAIKPGKVSFHLCVQCILFCHLVRGILFYMHGFVPFCVWFCIRFFLILFFGFVWPFCCCRSILIWLRCVRVWTVHGFEHVCAATYTHLLDLIRSCRAVTVWLLVQNVCMHFGRISTKSVRSFYSQLIEMRVRPNITRIEMELKCAALCWHLLVRPSLEYFFGFYVSVELFQNFSAELFCSLIW